MQPIQQASTEKKWTVNTKGKYIYIVMVRAGKNKKGRPTVSNNNNNKKILILK